MFFIVEFCWIDFWGWYIIVIDMVGVIYYILVWISVGYCGVVNLEIGYDKKIKVFNYKVLLIYIKVGL